MCNCVYCAYIYILCVCILYLTMVDGGSCVVYQKNAVPFEVIQFLTVFLDGALLYMVHYAKEVKGQCCTFSCWGAADILIPPRNHKGRVLYYLPSITSHKTARNALQLVS